MACLPTERVDNSAESSRTKSTIARPGVGDDVVHRQLHELVADFAPRWKYTSPGTAAPALEIERSSRSPRRARAFELFLIERLGAGLRVDLGHPLRSRTSPEAATNCLGSSAFDDGERGAQATRAGIDQQLAQALRRNAVTSSVTPDEERHAAMWYDGLWPGCDLLDDPQSSPARTTGGWRLPPAAARSRRSRRAAALFSSIILLVQERRAANRRQRSTDAA